ncbi:hypothetical protein GCM10010493_02180 [Streptomyces lavendulae subsp. grasserius]
MPLAPGAFALPGGAGLKTRGSAPDPAPQSPAGLDRGAPGGWRRRLDVGKLPARGRSGREAGGMYTDTDRCVRAVQSKDARFDGWFFTAVRTTGI